MHTVEQLRRGALAGTRRLTLREGLREFPAEIFALADSLEILDLSGNALSALPDELPRLHRLRIIFCSDNRFSDELPAVLGRCAQLEMIGFKANRIRRVPAEALPPRLRWLILTDNAIDALPAEIGRCTRLQKLALAGNRLRELPAEMAACSALELLRISANRLTALPHWLPALPRLSWLAYAGNPFCEALEAQALAEVPLPALPWPELRLHERLGEGASGVIHRAERSDGSPVAVKVFKGELTSDGLPRSEMAAAMLAGAHPHLIPVLGRLSEHPQQAQGLVMQLIAPEFRSLAQPPSLDSCTRDVYPDGSRLAAGSALRLASGIAAAAQQLHQRGISHGDLYGHNILHDGRGQALLGDFGAASLFDPDERATALALQHIEVRAFGCLLEELLAQGGGEELRALMQACLDEVPANRPLFETLALALRGLTPAS